MKIKRRRSQEPTVRFDRAAWRELMDAGQIHAARGIVVQEGASHFELVEGGADVLVDVELQPSGERITARLGGLGGGPAAGIWAIPPVGAEVVILVPDGDLEAGAVIVACESTGSVPDGLGPTTIVICPPAGGQVLVHDGDAGEAVELATKADLDALAEYVNVQFDASAGHVHVTPSGPTTTITTGTASSPVPVTPVPPLPDPAPQAVGTAVLKAK